MNDLDITLDHLKQAAKWALQTGQTPSPIDGTVRSYQQSSWDCGTSCCMWGAAVLMVKKEMAHEGPSDEWKKQSLIHQCVNGLLLSSNSVPQQLLDLLTRGANLRDANLRDANLRDANLRDANLRDANLRDANLSDADLRGADLRDANLRDANLRGADLRDANLRDANLSDADLSGADLSDADLSGATIKIGNTYRKIQ